MSGSVPPAAVAAGHVPPAVVRFAASRFADPFDAGIGPLRRGSEDRPAIGRGGPVHGACDPIVP